MINVQVSVHDWLQLPMEVRMKMREIFGVKKSQGSLVEGNVVKSDGSTYVDLQAITVEKMQKFLDSSLTDFVDLFNRTVGKIEVELEAEKPVVQKVDPLQVILDEWASRLSTMSMQAKSLNLEEAFKTLISKFLPNEPTAPAEVKQERAKKRGRPSKKAGN